MRPLNLTRGIGYEFAVKQFPPFLDTDFSTLSIPILTTLPDDYVNIRKGEKVLIGQPRIIPDKFLENLSALFKSTEDVDEAFFAQIHFTSRPDGPHIIIQVKFREGFKGDLASLDSGIKEAIRGTVDVGFTVDFAVVTDKPYEGTRRFYKREEF